MSIFIYKHSGCENFLLTGMILEVYNEKIYSQSKIDSFFLKVVFKNKKDLKNKHKKTIIRYRRQKNIIKSSYREEADE